MAYNRMTVQDVLSKFGVRIHERAGLFSHVAPQPVSALLTETLKRNAPLAQGSNSEKARSEFLIAPILAELRVLLEEHVSVFSGIKFNVDPKSGLNGICDFIVARSENQLFLEAPVVVLAEAKREDLPGGIGQCVAEMIAAQRFNKKRGDEVKTIFGCISSGTNWLFLKLEGVEVTIDTTVYQLTDVDKVLGILRLMCETA